MFTGPCSVILGVKLMAQKGITSANFGNVSQLMHIMRLKFQILK
jgi:hypothetical protein